MVLMDHVQSLPLVTGSGSGEGFESQRDRLKRQGGVWDYFAEAISVTIRGERNAECVSLKRRWNRPQDLVQIDGPDET